MDNGCTKGSFRPYFGDIKEAAGTLPGDKKSAAESKAEKSGSGNLNAIAGMKDTVRAIEIWMNEGGAGGEANR